LQEHETVVKIDFDLVLWYANVAASMLLLARLVQQNLWRTYQMLCLYLIADIVQQAAGLMVLGYYGKLGVPYLKIYATGQAVKVVLVIFIVLELYRIALADYPAVGRYARGIAKYLLLGATAVAAGVLWLFPPALNSAGWRLKTEYVFGIERTVDSVSLFLLLFMGAFLVWFPVRVSRNIAWCLGCFSTYLCARWFALFFAGLRPELVAVVNHVVPVASLGCFLTMAYVMRWSGEESTVAPGNRWNPKRMQLLRSKLDALEAYLARLGNKHRNIAENAALHSSKL
jgi:hypothetical protein